MSDLENYASLVVRLFGPSSVHFDVSKKTRNNVTGALNNPVFQEFTTNFTTRLERLKSIYKGHPTRRKEIITQINLIAENRNWQGAFAELAAFDHFHQDYLNRRSYMYLPIKPNVTLSKASTFAGALGNKETNLDGYLDNCDLYFDVKCLKDVNDEILEGVYKQLKAYLKTDEFSIIAEYDKTAHYKNLSATRGPLIKELIQSIDPLKKPDFFQSSVVKNLNFRMRWGKGVLMTESGYHPYEHAQNLHGIIFNHANKFVKKHSTLIVYVSFPWYNGLISDFNQSNRKFYRAFSRRVFCQYLNDSTRFSEIIPEYEGDDSIYQVSQYISGIIFLEDNTILSRDPSSTNVKSFCYLNPNARNPIRTSLARQVIGSLYNAEYDDFEFDNY